MTQTAQMDQKQLKKHYQDAIEYLDDNYAYFLTHVLHIGRPIWTAAIATAAVQMQEKENALDKIKGKFMGGNQDDDEFDFNFLFSPVFASKLDTPALAFILAHETMHIILNHLKLIDKFVDRPKVKKLAEKMKKGRLTRDEIKDLIVNQQNAQRFNIAADCVINDYLVNSGMDDSSFYNKPGSPMYVAEAPEGVAMLCRGMDKVGENAAFLTVTDVYDMLVEQNKQKDQQEQQDAESGDGEGDGEGGEGEGGSGQGQPGGEGKMKLGEDMDGRGGQAIDSHDWMLDPDFADDLADAIDKMNEEIEQAGKMPSDLLDKKDEEAGNQTAAQQQLNNSMRAGSEEGNMKEFMGATGAKLGWVKLMKELDPDMFKEPGIAPPPAAMWHKRPRKLAGMPKRVVLPVRETAKREKWAHEKPSIVLALDVSGSIGPRDADRFIELAKSIPQERIKLFCCTFDTQYSAIADIQNETNFRIGGGTDFDAITAYIEDVVQPELNGKYPKAVVVITDGQAGMSRRPDEKEAAGWFWLISPADRADRYSYDASLNIGRRDKLENYVV